MKTEIDLSKYKNILQEKELKILELRNTGLTLESVGQRIGVTRERIRQIEAKAHEKIRVYDNENK